MNVMDKLKEIFKHFPGVGPRQAERFIYYLLRKDEHTLEELARLIPELKKHIKTCSDCGRQFEIGERNDGKCNTCRDTNRDISKIMVVGHDIDIDAIQKSGAYQGYYFVLGNNLPILEKDPEKKIRIKQLEARVTQNVSLQEIILATDATPEGDYTADYIKNYLDKHITARNIKISRLGRGLSTGSELEYADAETLKNAILGRQ